MTTINEVSDTTLFHPNGAENIEDLRNVINEHRKVNLSLAEGKFA